MRAHRKYLSVTDVQRELGLTADQVHQLIASRRLPAFRILGEWRIERELMDQMINDLYEESGAMAAPCPADEIPPPRPPADDPLTEPADDPSEREPAPPAATASASWPSVGAIKGLTGQQRRILELIGQGLNNAEIAASLTVEISTVKSHVSRILQRCALRDREQLIVLAWRSGVMSYARPQAS